jgi:hypothetical protein
MKNYLFGWTNIKWFLKETLAIFSSKPSYFSKKRIESGVAFLIAQFGMVYFLFKNIDKMDVYDICIWAATEFAVAGYMVSHIQREKKVDPSLDPSLDQSHEEQINS